ncbi:hypothetical protein JNJ66_06395 [Candidatus Saccharibacteria bacterium]|nr:hypothetical protein [Candidatus Saccharibacteria bacterium]
MDPQQLQIFLLVNVFLMGILAAVGFRHARAHFRPQEHDGHGHDTKHEAHAGDHATLPARERAKLLEKAQADYAKVLDRSVKDLEHDLQGTTGKLTKQLETMLGAMVESEVERYKAELARLRAEAEQATAKAQADIGTQHDGLKEKLAQELAAEKQKLVDQLDGKLADAVASFLTETLQHNVDLGAQSAYLTSMLEAHKDELVRGIRDDG